MQDRDMLIKKLNDLSDEQLLKDFEEAMAEVEEEGGPQPDHEGFERLWKKLIEQGG